MILRRTRLAASLRPGEAVLSIPAFPALGTADFTVPTVPAGGEIARSTVTLAALTLTRRDRALGLAPGRRDQPQPSVRVRVRARVRARVGARVEAN